ncbi:MULTISPECIES: phage major capsid protein [Bifidobacterium]|uniref:Phage capsid protein n=1 Tax=Bifidobacterium choerinum TaxID=35760 RepID=A0A2D3D7M1_9BIFI|nr:MULTISPECIES: phage major capsid protein [Bifidobacterium]ATU21064.1 phage capsid protein [Bifidobacterium choerinum]
MAENFADVIKRSDLGDNLIPDEHSTEIIQTLPESSVIMTRARKVPMSKKKKTQPVLATLPEAYWVDEGGLKQTTKTGWEDVTITAEELAVLVPIPDSVVEDADIDLWGAIRPLIAEAFGKKVDEAALFGVDKPASWGDDVFKAAKAAGNTVTATADLPKDVTDLAGKIAEEGFDVNGFASQAGLDWKLRGMRDANGQPIYGNPLAEGQPNTLYGQPLNPVRNGSWDATKATLLAADWTKFVYGVRQDITFKIFEEGVISDKAGKIVYNAMQQDSKIMRVVMRVGFAVANPMTRIGTKGKQYPAGFIIPSTASAGAGA